MQAVSLKVGTVYNARWVNQMYNQMKLVNPDVEFICLTDDPEGIKREIRIEPITDDFPDRKWWNKAKLFRPGLFDQPTLYLDLDCFVHQKFKRTAYSQSKEVESCPWGVTPFFNNAIKDKLNILKTYWFSDDMAMKIHQCNVNSSIMIIDENNGEPMWKDFIDNQELLYKSFYGLDPWLYRRHSNNLNFFKSKLAYSYKHGALFPDDIKSNTFRQLPICIFDDVDKDIIMNTFWHH